MSRESKQRIYLDYMATTPVDPVVLAEMLPYFSEVFANPATPYLEGASAKKAVTQARSDIAAAINADKDTIVFTSGATESNNLAIRGLASFLKRNRRTHIITQNTEHMSVLECFKRLETEGFTVTYLPVNSEGLIDPVNVEKAITAETGLVSIMAVNNEIGVIQPIEAIAQSIKTKNPHVLFHSDAAQAIGRINIDVKKMNIDLLSLSSHKIYGPKGIGALYVRTGIRKNLEPLILGGGQEDGLRSGTLPVALCVGMGAACRLVVQRQDAENKRLEKLRDQLVTTLQNAGLDFVIHGSRQHRVAHNLNLGFKGINNEDLMAAVEGIAIASGSACTAEKTTHSHVIEALGAQFRKNEAIRISLGINTTENKINKCAEELKIAINKIKSLS